MIFIVLQSRVVDDADTKQHLEEIRIWSTLVASVNRFALHITPAKPGGNVRRHQLTIGSNVCHLSLAWVPVRLYSVLS